MNNNNKDIIKIKCKDNIIIEISETMLYMSEKLKEMYNEKKSEILEIPIDTKIIFNIMYYIELYKNNNINLEIEDENIYDILIASEYLKISLLTEVLYEKISMNLIKMTENDIKKKYNIDNNNKCWIDEDYI